MKLKNIIVKNNRGNTPVYEDNDLIKDFPIINQACVQRGFINFDKLKYNKNSSKGAKGQLLKGDILICSTGGGTAGRVGYWDYSYTNYIADSHVTVLRVNNKNYSRYLYYYLSSLLGTEYIRTCIKGATNQEELSNKALNNFEIEVPNLEMQIKLASFLDERCSKIYKEIELLEKKSVLLDEYKNALIYETVTKGLDKNAKMKDSGVDWIGETVNCWPIKRLKDIYIYKNGYAFNDEDYCDESNAYLVKITNIGSEYDFKNMQNLKINQLTENFKIKNNSILYALSGSVGKCSFYNVIDNKNCYLNQRVAELTVKNGNVKYFYYVMSNNSFKNKILSMIQGNVIKNLNKGHLDDSFIPVPNIQIQNEIVKFLDFETKKIENQIELINKKIELLKEYKQSLIYEAVTGQLEI